MPRGDIFSVELPYRGGREQAGRRPAVAVQTNSTTSQLPTLMIVPMTSSLAALRFPHTVQIEASNTNGLTQPSVLLVFQLRAIDQKRVLHKIGKLEQHYLSQLDAEIKNLLDLA